MTIKNISTVLIPMLYLTTSSISMEHTALPLSCNHAMNNPIINNKKEIASVLMTEYVSKFIINSKIVVSCDEQNDSQTFSLNRPKSIQNKHSSSFVNTFFDTTYYTSYFIEKNKEFFVYYHISMDEEMHNSFMSLLDLIDDIYPSITIEELAGLIASSPAAFKSFEGLFLKDGKNAPWMHGCVKQNLIYIEELNTLIDIDVLWNKELNKTILLGKKIYTLPHETKQAAPPLETIRPSFTY